MKYSILFILFLSAFFSGAQDFPDGEVAAVVNGEIITQQEVMKVLNMSYGEEEAEALSFKVIRAVLEEMIVFKVIEQNMKGIKVKCSAKDYRDCLEQYETPFFSNYLGWGIKNPISFGKILYKIVQKDKKLKAEYSKKLAKVATTYPVDKTGKLLLELVWLKIISNNKLRNYVRFYVYQKYHLNTKIFKTRIKHAARFQKHVSQSITEADIDNIIKEDTFALKGGAIQIAHIFIHHDKSEEDKAQQKAYKTIQKVRQLIKDDLSNFSEIASLHSEDKTSKFRGGQIGWVPRWNTVGLFSGFVMHLGWIPHWTAYVDAMVEVGYRMEENQLSKPIESKMGYHLLYVVSRKEGKEEDVNLRDKAKSKLALLKMEEKLADWLKNSKIERKI